MRRKGIVLLLVAALTLWALPTLALANDVTSSGEVGTTEASINVDEGTAEASASAASSSETGEFVGVVEASANEVDENDDDGEVDNGGGSNTEIGTNWGSKAETNTDPLWARAQESVGDEDVTVSAPDGLPFNTLAKIDISKGEAHVSDEIIPNSYNASWHTMGSAATDTVFLFDIDGDNPANQGIIRFEEGGAWAYSWFEDGSEPFASSEIADLSIWDPDLSDYVLFGDFENLENSTTPSAPPDLTLINALLAKSNLKMSKLLDVGLETTDASTFAWATLMEVLYPASGDILLKLILADVSSQTNFAEIIGPHPQRQITDAWAKGRELYFEFTPPAEVTTPPEEVTTPPTPTEPPPPPPTEPTPTVTAPQPEIQPVQPQQEVQPVAQPAQPQAQPTPSRGEQRQLPVTGFNYLWLLLGVGLILTGLRLRRI